MAATEAVGGQHSLATNQVSSVQVASAVTEGADGESMQVVSEPQPFANDGDLDPVHGKEHDYIASEKGVEQKDTEASVHPYPESDTSETENEAVVVKTEEDFEFDEKPATANGNHSEMEASSLENRERQSQADTDIKADPEQAEDPGASRPRVSAAEDLDEMMDIGTVDQVDQEAQMKEEQNVLNEGNGQSPTTSNTVSVAEDYNSFEDENDVKPTVLPPPAEMEGAGSGSEYSPAPVMNGMKVVKVDAIEMSDSSTQFLKPSDSPALVKVKDEPVDEEYEQAFSSTATASVKDEPNTTKEDLRIGSVFTVPPAAELQAAANQSSLHMSCFNCKKSLIKGQTAFQRKGWPALFCSTACLTSSLPSAKGSSKICYNCQKLIFRPQDVILAPDAKGVMKEFCSQTCLSSFNYKKNATNVNVASPGKTSQQSAGPKSVCSVCSRCCVSKHEVILSGAVHKICSDACFNRFRTVNNLAMAGCASCGSCYHNNPLMLKMQGSTKTVCNAMCLAKFKEQAKVSQPCMMCSTVRPISEMVDSKNNDDLVNLFCSSSCVMAFKVQTVSASGARLHCDSCGRTTVPAYHLAMSDTSIRNFCGLPCVMSFQEKFKKSQTQMNVFTKLPIGSSHNQTVTPVQPQKDASKERRKLSCFQCSRHITFKPEYIQTKDKLVFVCSADCSGEFKKINTVTSLCEYCKVDKVTREAKRINNKDCFFCSDGCKLLYGHELTKSWGKHCQSCVYCHSASKKLVTAQYGGSTEEFCSEECRSKYTMLFCHVAKCDTCGRKGKLRQSLPLLGEVKHFCDLTCMLHFCCEKVSAQGEVPKAEDTPIIANVVSLAGPPSQKSTAPEQTTQQSTTSKAPSKNCEHVSIQTDPVKTPPPKVLKNKALLCRPLVQNKGVSCKTQTVDVEAQTDDVFPKVMIVPVPVPVYVPVPMNMYTQYTPKPVSVPLPVPVPMFLPVTMDSAERIVETIQEIKEKIPSDPFEAELILMAEMVAEQEQKNDKDDGEKPQEKAEKEDEKQEASAPEDHTSNYSDDLDTEELASFLNDFEDASSDAALASPSSPSSNEKLNPILDIPETMSSEPDIEAAPPQIEDPPPAPSMMDIEADVTVENLEKMARLREQSQRSPSPPPDSSRRRQAPRKAREKKGRKSLRVAKAAEASSQRVFSKKDVVVDAPKLKSEYGVEAWKQWIQWRQTQPNLKKPRYGSRPMELKEDVLRCTTAELSYGLCCFIHEVKRPNGDSYSPDSLFYLCLGIQQYLFENGRVENIFMDRFYSKFSSEFTDMLRSFKPSITASGYLHSRVEEEFLWDCKQLGAYSPIVLLNTLLFFCCKNFGFTTVEQHRQLSFAHVMRCTKTNHNLTKTTFLRFYPPISLQETDPDLQIPAKRRKEEESKEEILEMVENTENPLRCPVRLYEFYLSKCSESVKQRTNVFYLHPERCCVPNSPLWFSSTPLDDSTLESMLTRILTVRELHLSIRKRKGLGQQTSTEPPFIPEDEEEDGDSE
ncbi:uncharacterized protein V6R79_025494 [Siganus canaliculatus]